jgi:predicted Zn finger-like uncharacterized protein
MRKQGLSGLTELELPLFARRAPCFHELIRLPLFRLLAMNTNCPQCDSSYNVTEAHIGRKVKCKSCGAALIVTENGLELKGAAAPVPPPPPANEFDLGDDRDRDDDPPRRGGKSRNRNDDEDYDDRDSGKKRGKKREPKGPSNLGEYLTFRKMVVPVIIQAIFWLLVGLIILAALIYVIMAAISGVGMAIIIALAGAIIGVPVYILIIRIYCELLIVVFRMNSTLTDIKTLLEKQQSQP